MTGLTACRGGVAGAQDQTTATPATVSYPALALEAGPTETREQPTRMATPTLAPTSTATSSATIPLTDTATPTLTATRRPTATSEPTGTATPLPTDIPAPTPTATPRLPTPNPAYTPTLTVPILMYHYISTPPEDADIYRRDLSVTPEQFREQMAYLAENGFTTIDLYDLSRALADKQLLPAKPVVLTFDDGYIDAYQNAFPILQEFGFKGTFFIITEYVDRELPEYMSWAMIEEMAAAGHRMESHSKTHADLYGASQEELVWQLLGSQETLAAHIGYTPRYFCYPSGRYDENTVQALRDLDFWGAVTTAGGKWHTFDGRYEWSRWRVRDVTTLAEFADLVEPAQ